MKGIGVSSGVGIGKIYRIEPCSPDYTPHTPTDPLAESVRFHEAVEQFCKNTVQQAYTLSVTAGKEEAKILLGHINIVKDPYLQEEVEKLIQEGHCSEAAFECLCDKFVDIFTSSEDELTRQRAADILISYTLSADRNSGETAYLCSVYQPSVLRIIKNIIEAANRCHIPVSMCGEAAADPKMIPLLISFGLTDFTVAATSVLRVRKCIAGWTKAKADEITEKVMTFSTQKEVENFLLNQILP